MLVQRYSTPTLTLVVDQPLPDPWLILFPVLTTIDPVDSSTAFDRTTQMGWISIANNRQDWFK